MIKMKSEYRKLEGNQGTRIANGFMCGQYDCCILVREWNWIIVVGNRSMCGVYDDRILVLEW